MNRTYIVYAVQNEEFPSYYRIFEIDPSADDDCVEQMIADFQAKYFNRSYHVPGETAYFRIAADTPQDAFEFALANGLSPLHHNDIPRMRKRYPDLSTPELVKKCIDPDKGAKYNLDFPDP